MLDPKKAPRPHKTLERKGDSGCQALMLTEGKHAGIIFSYGKVEFKEDTENNTLGMHFEYEVHETFDIEYDKKEFEEELAEFLHELIIYGIDQNEITYTGGIDENRTDDSEQSDLR